MGLLLHALHTHQPLPRGEYPTAKWPEGCTHLPTVTPGLVPNGMVRAQWLIDANKAAHTSGFEVKWHLVATDHEATIRALAGRVNVAEGHNLNVARGCSLAYLVFGPLKVAVEYESERGQREIIAADPDDCQEGIAPSVSVLRVYLNGCWCDAADVASADQITKWEVDIMEGGDE